ncbi:Cyclopropane fatty acid synthase [Pararobbsia alpina]|uniref:DUF1365 domain-containing protein n=1 Tax=Pararobbsia alpina TaxID=621374 RepID=UPI0039A74EFE
MNTHNVVDASAARLLTGYVSHARLRPVRHAFRYPVFQVLCDLGRLDELPRWWFGVDRTRLVSIHASDFGPRDGRPLDAWMRERLAQEGIPANGAIWLQAIPRIAGYAFNPVCFWYCHDTEGRLRALYADVRNTFGEHHGYLLSAPDHEPITDDSVLMTRKTFHVSPFCDVDGHYAFRVRRDGRRLVVCIDYDDATGPLLRTAIGMHIEPFDGRRVCRVLLTQPFVAVGVMARIHWQALRLWIKRVPFHGTTPPSAASGSTSASGRDDALQLARDADAARRDAVHRESDPSSLNTIHHDHGARS